MPKINLLKHDKTMIKIILMEVNVQTGLVSKVLANNE